jgi:hypothetical protein
MVCGLDDRGLILNKGIENVRSTCISGIDFGLILPSVKNGQSAKLHLVWTNYLSHFRDV